MYFMRQVTVRDNPFPQHKSTRRKFVGSRQTDKDTGDYKSWNIWPKEWPNMSKNQRKAIINVQKKTQIGRSERTMMHLLHF